MATQSQQTLGVLLLLVVVACAAAAAPAQQPAQQARSTSAAPAPAPAKNTTSAPKTATASAVDEINKLPCERVKCSVYNLDPVCAVGEGVAGCKPADKGCTYTNGCMARCVYGAKVAYLGECKHEGAMRIAEDAGQGRGAPAKRDCKCDWKFEPVCASIPACTIPGGCTYASDCYAKCAGAADKDIRKGACKNSRRLLEQQRALMI